MTAFALGAPAEARDRFAALRVRAEQHPGGVIDCSIGTPCDAVPAFVTDAVTRAVAQSGPYPLSAGSPAYREAAAAWISRRFGVELGVEQVAACVGTKEFVASLPHLLRVAGLTSDERDTVLVPAVAYPTYAVGAQIAGARSVAVALDDAWRVDVASIDADDAARAAVLWLNVPGNPTGSTAGREHFAAVVEWARARGIVTVSDECYVEFAHDARTVLEAGIEHTLALHSLSKRSNFAGMRAGFYAGDPGLVTKLAEVRREAGYIVPTPVQAAAIAALGDDRHVAEQRARYERRRALLVDRLAAHGIVRDGGAMAFYLWLRDETGGDGWQLAERFACAGTVVSPGATFGRAGTGHVRLALVQPDDKIAMIADRLDEAAEKGTRA